MSSTGATSSSASEDAELFAGQAVFACELIQQMGILLRLPQVAVSTAQVSFHRFYAKKSMRKFDVRVRPHSTPMTFQQLPHFANLLLIKH